MAKKTATKTKPLPSLGEITKAIEKYETKLRAASATKEDRAAVKSVLQLLSETKRALRVRCRPADARGKGGHSPIAPK